MKKICLAIPSLHPGGMERVMSELAWYFSQKEELEVHLVLYGIKRDVFYAIPDNLQIYRPSFPFDNSKRFWHTLKTMWFLRKTIKKIAPNSTLSFGEYWNNFVLFATLGLDYPIFVSDRCRPDKSLGRIHNALRRWLYPKAIGVIVQTEKAKKIYSGIFHHHNIKVIGNPIREINSISSIEKENIILSVGRLIESKHHDELIKIFVGLNKPDWKLVIVGDDALKQRNKGKLEALVKSLNAEDRVILAGKQIEVDEFYLKSKVFAFTSSSEGFPNVIGEAMSAGLPVVAFDCIAGPSELIIDGETGFLIPLFDYRMFGRKLSYLMENESLCSFMGNRGKIKINQNTSSLIGEKFYNFMELNQ